MIYFVKYHSKEQRWEISPVENPTPEILENLDNTLFDGVKKNECYVDMRKSPHPRNIGVALNWGQYFIMR